LLDCVLRYFVDILERNLVVYYAARPRARRSVLRRDYTIFAEKIASAVAAVAPIDAEITAEAANALVFA